MAGGSGSGRFLTPGLDFFNWDGPGTQVVTLHGVGKLLGSVYAILQ